jgi:membrane protein YqaA with SNARE-associated domain
LKIFSALYDRVLRWAGHPHAERYLAGLSFAESSFFPIPPDVMLAPMTLARPDRGWRFAFVTTVSSVVGGLAGYAIGWVALDAIEPLLMSLGYWDAYIRSTEWFARWGFLAVLAAGFSPIPYKIFTIAAGALHMFLPAFALASLVGRGGRFFLVAGLILWGGEPMERRLRTHVDTIGWLVVALAVIGIAALQLH